MWLLSVFIVGFSGWQLFHDGPLAYYIIQGILVAALCLRLAKGSSLWLVYLYGAFMGLMTSGCGALFSARADSYQFLCDKGTGLPISTISGFGALAVAAYLLARGQDE